MAFSLDPQQLISDAITKLVNSAVIVGLPTKEAPVPLFVLCEIPHERATTSARLPGHVTQAGELKSRVVIEPSTYELTAILSDFDSKNSGVFKAVQTALAGVSALTNSFASFGAVLPNLSNITTGYVSSQIAQLTQIKNNFMPVMVLGAYFNLGVLVQTTPYLLSKWYIEGFDAPHEGGKAGTVITIRLREQFEPRDTSLGKGLLKAIAGEIGSPLAGQVLGLAL